MLLMQKAKILNIYVHLTDHRAVVDSIFKASRKGLSDYICAANVHMCMEAFDNAEYGRIINNAAMTVPDGRPLVWAQKLLGHHNARQVRGSDLMLNVCKEAEKRGFPLGLYGGSPKAITGFQHFLEQNFPNLRIACAISPPFRELSEDEDKKYIETINDSGAKILFVGLGCPKQEYWMAEHKGKINCTMIGIGAVFVFFGDTNRQAPITMQKTGTEWIFRLATERGRLWHRYLRHNPRFIYHLTKQLFSKIINMPKRLDAS